MGYESKIKNRAADDLFDAIMSIEDLDECYKFFSDLCTVKEIRAMAQRYGVAKLLLDKKTYSEIEEATGASTATISRIRPNPSVRCRRLYQCDRTDEGRRITGPTKVRI